MLRSLIAQKYRVQMAARRACCAWKYFRHRSTEADAWQMYHDTQHLRGSYPLETLDVGDVLDWAEEQFEPRPDLPELAARAADYVARKWNSSGDLAGSAQDWAIEVMRELAADSGNPLTPRPEYEN